MAPSRKSVTQAAVAALADLKGKGKIIEVAEPAERRSNLSDVHISTSEILI